MKRVNLLLNEIMLEEATRLSGAKTYSAAVDMALREFVRRARARRILDLAGTGLWEGDLSAMRGCEVGGDWGARRWIDRGLSAT